MTPELDRIIDPAYVAALDDRTIDQIRGMRDECQALENGLSYVRRLIQGRLDIVGAELAHRRGGDRVDLHTLVSELPTILSAGTQGGSVAGAQPPLDLDPEEGATEALEQRLEAVISTGELAELSSLDEEALQAIVTRVSQFEEEISARRRQIHEVIDRIRAEITRRYRDGEASVDALLA